MQVFLMATDIFRAVWPVVEGNGTAETDAELILQALGDLPAVARRHNVTITGAPRACLTDGRRVPGSSGHRHVVVVEAPAQAIEPRPYRHATESQR